jgi:hypothetical protein
MPQHAFDPRAHIFGQPLDDRIGVGTELQIDAPFIIRLPMQKRRLPGVD